MKEIDTAVGAALMIMGSLGAGATWLILKRLTGIHATVDGNLSEVKKDLKLTAEALTNSNVELAAARTGIEFLKAQMLSAGVAPVTQKKPTQLTKKRASGAKC